MKTRARELTRNEFYKKWSSIFDAVFLVDRHGDVEFREVAWRTVLLPYGMNFEDRDLLALAAAASSVGDTFCVATDIETRPPHQYSRKISWDLKSFTEERAGSLLSHFDSVLFGKSGLWGCVCWFDDYSYLGGDESFMKIFLREAGGDAVLKDRFRHFADNEWLIGADVKSSILAKGFR